MAIRIFLVFWGDPANDDLTSFTEHVYHCDTGLNYMQARFQYPVIGRFLSIDPVGFRASMPVSFNRYAYANNNPYAFDGPDGRRGIRIVTSPDGMDDTPKREPEKKHGENVSFTASSIIESITDKIQTEVGKNNL